MISADFYTTAQTYADGEIERTDIINNLYSNNSVGSPYYLGYIEHDDFPKSFGVSLVDYARGMTFNRIESNHSWGYCFNKNVYNTTGTSPNLTIIQDANGHAQSGGDRYCFLNKIKMAQQNSINTVTFTMHAMYIPTTDIDESGTTYFNQGYGFASASVTATIEQIKNMIDGTEDVYESWTRNNVTYPALKYADFNEYGLALVQSMDGTMTAAICISQVNIGDSGRYSYGASTNVVCSVLPFFEHDYEDKHILAAQGTGFTDAPTIAWYQSLGIIRPHTNFGTVYDNQLYMFAPYPYDILVEDLPTYNLYQRSGLVKGQYFLQNYSVYSGYVAMYAYAHYDLKDIYTMMLYYHKIYTSTAVFSKSYTTDVSVATFNDHDGATGDRLSDDYVNISDELRDWQQPDSDIAVNEYDPADKPEYDPSGGDDNPTTSGGDDHLPRRGFSIGGTGGFVTQYALSYSQLHEFANMLWAQFGDADFISNIGTTFLNDYSIKPSDILNYIVSMRVYPFNLADSVSYTDTQSANIFIGRGVFPYILTTGNTHVIADTCETFDGGYCDVPTYYNDFRDYEPASSIEVYVPFCGSVSVAPSEVVGKRLRLTYGVDYSTGALSATLWVISDTNYTLAVLSGQVAASIQMSASNEMDGILRLTSIATTIGKAMLTEDKIDASKMSDTAKHVSNATNALGMASDLVNSVGSGLPVHSIGNTNGFSNFATPPRACVTITYHKYKNPQNFAHVYGYKCNRRETLSSLNGYTKCTNVDVSGFTCHEDERSEIKALLESGVYL